MKIKLKTIDEIKLFAKEVVKFKSDVNIYHENPKNFYDAKSLLALFAIDVSDYANIEIKSDDEEEINLFYKTMKKFEKEN